MFFNRNKKKKEEPKPESKPHPLKKQFMDKSLANTKLILAKLEAKRRDLFDMGRVKDGNEDAVNDQFDKMSYYMKNVNWSDIIDNTLTNATLQDIDGAFTKRVDEQTARFLIQLTWDSVRADINKMIEEILILVYPRGSEDESHMQ